MKDYLKKFMEKIFGENINGKINEVREESFK